MHKIPRHVAALHKLRIEGNMLSGGSARDRSKLIWNYIISTEDALGSQFLVTKDDHLPYVVLAQTKEVLQMPPIGKGGDQVHSYIASMYGLDRTEPVAKAAYVRMRDYAMREGLSVDIRRFSAYDTKSATSYISTYDGEMWKIDGTEPKRVANGEDEIFFIDDDGGQPVSDVDIGPHGILFDYHASLRFAALGLGGMTAEQQRMCWIVWMFALAFPDLLPTKPLALIEGPKGSGKTSGVQLLQLMLIGKWKAMGISQNQEADFGVLLLRAPIGLLDNMDTYFPWVADKIAQYTTSGEFPKRKLFTDSEEISIRPHSFPVVATRNPASFRRDDVTDRLIIFRLDRWDSFKRFDRLRELVVENRGKLFGEYLYYINRIVEEIRNGAYDEDAKESHRMADFAAFARVVARVMGWSAEDVDGLMEAMENERIAFAAEDDPLPELLREWVATKRRDQPRPNAGRAVNIRDLFRELKSLAERPGMEIQFYKSSGSLAKQLPTSHIAREFRIDITIEKGERIYRIWKQKDPQLKSVPMPKEEASFDLPLADDGSTDDPAPSVKITRR